jgi:hypothetical protein
MSFSDSFCGQFGEERVRAKGRAAQALASLLQWQHSRSREKEQALWTITGWRESWAG